MGQRRAGLERLATRRGLAQESAGGSGAAADIYDPAVWYVWGFRPSIQVWGMGFVGANSTRLQTYPHDFFVSGTITHLAVLWIAGGGAGRSVRFHIYDTLASNVTYPGALLYSSASIQPGTGFARIATTVTPELDVTAPARLWAGQQESADGGDGVISINGDARFALGTLWNPAASDLNANANLTVSKVGYKPANTYANGAPANFPAVGTPEESHADVMRTSGSAPCLIFKFEPAA